MTKKNGFYNIGTRSNLYADGICYGYIKEVEIDSIKMWFWHANDSSGRTYQSESGDWKSVGADTSKNNARENLKLNLRKICSIVQGLIEKAVNEKDEKAETTGSLADAQQERAENSVGL